MVTRRPPAGMRRLLGPVSIALATVVGTAIGLLVAWVLPGRLSDVVAVTGGTAVAVLVGIVAAPHLRDTIRSAIPSLWRAPSEITGGIAEWAAQRLPTEELLRRSAESLRSGLDSPRVEIWRAKPGGGMTRVVALGTEMDAPPLAPPELVVAARIGVAGEGWTQRWLPRLVTPSAPGDDRRVPMRIASITDAGDLLGLVVVGRPPGAARYDHDDDEALGAACRLLAAILRNRQLNYALEASLADLRATNEQLQASRNRIVTAADAERLRIERDLHDGAQQHLLALAVTVGLVRQMVSEGESPAEIEQMLVQLGDDVRATIGQVRELAQGIYPALLMDGGLEPALRAVAGRSRLDVRVEAVDVGRYPPNLEAAVYFCALEALQNAAKHAARSEVTVHLRQRDGLLQVSVRDTGPGFDASAPTAGMGRTTMADRVGALGGTVRWDSAPGTGTTVLVEIPVPAA